jgi:hypothetical protein
MTRTKSCHASSDKICSPRVLLQIPSADHPAAHKPGGCQTSSRQLLKSTQKQENPAINRVLERYDCLVGTLGGRLAKRQACAQRRVGGVVTFHPCLPLIDQALCVGCN